MNILFYFPSNQRTIPIDVPLFELQKQGHRLFMLTTAGRGPLHDLYERNGARVFATATNRNKLLRYVLNVWRLITICKKYKIDVVHSHLQQANVIAVVASYLMKTRVAIFRHHCKFHFLLKNTSLRPSTGERTGDWLINKLAKRIIVPSQSVMNAMVQHENVDARKIDIIPYIYDFNSMRKVNGEEVERLKSTYPARLRIIMVSRMTPYKRHLVALRPIMAMIHQGCDIQVLVMDEGPEKENIQSIVAEHGMEQRIHFPGFQRNILEYISSADVIVHPSLTEASNSAVKEAALLGKIVVACDNVGDFNEYIINGENGFLLSPEHFEDELPPVLKTIYQNPASFMSMGGKLHDTVVRKFTLTNVIINKYELL